MRFFTILLGMSALVIAGIAAYFSVYGIAKLFSASIIPVAIMASSLEAGKLVTASYLYRFWKTIGKSLKIYLCIGLFILMMITSSGIFGYLTSAYQGSIIKLQQQQTKIELLNEKIERLRSDKNRIQSEKENFQASLDEELKGLVIKENSRYYDTKVRKQTLERWQPLIDDKEEQLKKTNGLLLEAHSKLSGLKLALLDTGIEVGPIFYISELFDISMGGVVKYFIFLIIFVFDPLAVSLIIAFNKTLGDEKKFRNEKKLIIADDDTNSIKNIHIEEERIENDQKVSGIESEISPEELPEESKEKSSEMERSEQSVVQDNDESSKTEEIKETLDERTKRFMAQKQNRSKLL